MTLPEKEGFAVPGAPPETPLCHRTKILPEHPINRPELAFSTRLLLTDVYELTDGPLVKRIRDAIETISSG